MIHALSLMGVAYRLRRCRKLMRRGHLSEARRVSLAVERDLVQMRA